MKVSKLNGKRSVQMRNVKMIGQYQALGTSIVEVASIPIDQSIH